MKDPLKSAFSSLKKQGYKCVYDTTGFNDDEILYLLKNKIGKRIILSLNLDGDIITLFEEK